jgi:hypothetical protein
VLTFINTLRVVMGHILIDRIVIKCCNEIVIIYVRIIRGSDCDTTFQLVVAKVRNILPVCE